MFFIFTTNGINIQRYNFYLYVIFLKYIVDDIDRTYNYNVYS